MRLSMKSTLVLIFGPCIIAATAQDQEGNGEQARAISRIRELRGAVIRDNLQPGTPVIEVDLMESDATDADLALLKTFTSLRRLNLGMTAVSDNGIAILKRLSTLEDLTHLDLEKTSIGDAGLAHLSRLTSLQDLNLSDTPVTDAGLAHLKGLTRLSALDLRNTEVSDACLGHLKGMTSLKTVELSDTKISDTGVRMLQRELPTLKIQRTTSSRPTVMPELLMKLSTRGLTCSTNPH